MLRMLGMTEIQTQSVVYQSRVSLKLGSKTTIEEPRKPALSPPLTYYKLLLSIPRMSIQKIQQINECPSGSCPFRRPEQPGFSILLSLWSSAFNFFGILIFFNGIGKGTRCIPFNKMGLHSSGTLGCITPWCREMRKLEKHRKTPPSTCC